MKDRKTFTYCEYCNTAWEDVSPPTKEQYKNGFIKIGDSSAVMLDTKGIAHAFSLYGIYCNSDCLMKNIEKARSVAKLEAK